MIALGAMSAVQAALIGGFAWFNLSQSLSGEIGQRALNAAQTVAATPSIIHGIEQRDLASLHKLTDRFSEINQALFVVIGDNAGIRLAHPNPDKLGKSMADDEGDSGDEVLQLGQAYVTKAVGSLGASMRARAPVFDVTGEVIIGVVSVGYSLNQIDVIIGNYGIWLMVVLILSFIGSFTFAVLIARRLKREIFGLEPEEIARLFEEREATLQSVREGIIAINRDGVITTINKTAVETLGLDPPAQLRGRLISEVLPDSELSQVMDNGHPQFDEEIWLNNKLMIANRVPLHQGNKIIGAVSSFRLRDEVDLVSQKLTRIEQYAESLRSQTHEYSNKLHTIAGLIQLDAKQEALALIGAETHDHQNLIALLLNAIHDPIVAGCLIGKYNRARAMGLKLIIDPESSLSAVPRSLTSDQLVSVLGNLIDNALEASLQHHGSDTEVLVSLTDIGNDLIIEVEDHGPGIPEALQQQIFARGFSSKNGLNHGIGLHLIDAIVRSCNGSLDIENVNPNGSRFILYLPKSRDLS